MVIGNPTGRRHTVSYGIVDKPTCGGGTQIQVSRADIGPGNSGGPIFNNRGEQIAHVHVKIWTAHNISRHIRVDHVRDAFAKVFSDEARYKQRLGLKVDCQSDRARVIEVEPDSAASQADVRKGDVITQINSMRVEEGYQYILALMDLDSDAPVTLRIRREGQIIEKSLKPERQ